MRPFTRLFLASTISNLGDGVLLAALPLVARRLTDDPLTISAVSAAATAPWLLFGLTAGAIVDRVHRVRLMVAVDVARAALLAGFALLVVSDRTSIALLAVLVALIGIGETLFDTAAQSVVPAVVSGDRLEAANGRLFGAQLAANGFVGPPMGAALFAVAAGWPLALDAMTFAVSAALLWGVRRHTPVPTSPATSTLRADVREGLSWLWADPGIRAFAIGAATINLAHTAVMAIAVLFVRDELGAGATSFGLTLTGAAVGGLTGTVVAPWVVRRVGRRRAVIGAIAAFGAGLLVAGTASTVVATASGLAVLGAAGEVWNVVAVSYRQARVPDRLLGRVMASYRVLAYGAMPVGALAGGALARFGLRTPFLVGAAVVGALLVYFVPATRGEVLPA
ncbi:MAG TPA: MFS transporter [Acidimicrobiales bacterium]|nr:MFS transporter [Acidimicrobiales bacterium]